MDSTAGKLDTISAEPLRVWRVTGTVEAIEAFRVAVGGVIVPDEDVIGVIDAAVVAQQVAAKTAQVAVLQASLDAATARMDAYLDSTAGSLDTISATPLRIWNVTGSDVAIEAFRVAVNGTVVPDEDVVGALDAGVVAKQVTAKTEQMAVLQASLDAATVELTDLQATVAQLQVDATPVDIVPVIVG